jgi:hypothetical protein
MLLLDGWFSRPEPYNSVGGMKMSIRSTRIPGKRLGLGSFINSDIDAKRRVITFGIHTWTAGSVIHKFTQGQTRIAEIDTILLSYNPQAALASASIDFKIGTATGGTVKIRLIPNTSLAANTNKQTILLHYWMVGTPDPQRMIV